MRCERSNFSLPKDKWPTLTPFEADLSRYLHMTDCRALENKWADYWEFCPMCGVVPDKGGYLNHRPKKDVAC